MEILDAGYQKAIFAVFALVLVLICRKVTVVSRSTGSGGRFAAIFCAGMAGWFVLSLVLSMNGFFRSSTEYSPGDLAGLVTLVALMNIPLVLFCIAYRTTDALKNIIDSVNVQDLIGIQAFRICGSYFLFLAWANRSPAMFALPAGVLDLLIGVSALIIPRLFAKNVTYAGTLASVWSYVGLADLAVAFTMYFLYFPFRILEAPAPQIVIGGFYPIAFIVMFPVPLAIVLHVLTLMKVRKRAVLPQ
jgi:hypothetical protein